MAALFSIKRLIVGLLAVGTVAMTGSFASAQTWVGNASAGSKTNWFNGANWTGGAPSAGQSANFGATATTMTPSISATNTPALGGLVVAQGTGGGYTLNATTGHYVFQSGATISNNRRVGPSGNGLTINNVEAQGALTLSGTGATSVSNVFGSSGSVSVTNGNVTFVGASAAPITTAGGTTTFTTSNLSINNGDLTLNSGVLRTNSTGGNFSTANVAGDVVLNGGTTQIVAGFADADTIASDAFNATDVVYGGALSIDWSQVGSNLFNDYAFAQIFSGATKTGTFSSITLTNAASPYAGLAFTAIPGGNSFTTGSFTGMNGESQWLVFQGDTGRLVVVPEPSTIVFAGVGVAMAGWSAWKKRRLAKVLAKK